MALTSYPTIVFNSVSGSNDFSSGAGPSDPIIGTATAVTSTTVTLTISSGDLTNVAQNGSAVLYMSGVGFARIGSHNGVNSLVVEPVISGTAVPFAIGGKRATLDHPDSRRLFTNYIHPASGNSAGAGHKWEIYGEDSGAFVFTSGLTISVTTTGANNMGDVSIYGGSGLNRLVWLQTAAQPAIRISGALALAFNNLDFQITGSAQAVFLISAAPTMVLNNCSIGNASGVNTPTSIYVRGTNGAYPAMICNNSAFIGLASGITNGTASALSTFALRNSEFSKCASDVSPGFSTTNFQCYKSILSHNSGNVLTSSLTNISNIIVIDCVFDNNLGAAIRKNVLEPRDGNVFIANSQFTNNIFGIQTVASTTGIGSQTMSINHCNFYNNISGNISGGPRSPVLNNTNSFIDPQYINNSRNVRNYGVGTVMRQLGYVTGVVGNSDNQTRSYGVIGVAQRDESAPAAAGGETSYIFG